MKLQKCRSFATHVAIAWVNHCSGCVLCLLIDSVFSLQLQIWLLNKDHTGNLNHQETMEFLSIGGLSSRKIKLVVKNWVQTLCFQHKSTSSGVRVISINNEKKHECFGTTGTFLKKSWDVNTLTPRWQQSLEFFSTGTGGRGTFGWLVVAAVVSCCFWFLSIQLKPLVVPYGFLNLLDLLALIY